MIIKAKYNEITADFTADFTNENVTSSDRKYDLLRAGKNLTSSDDISSVKI